MKLNYYTYWTIRLTVPRCLIFPTVFESIILNGPLQLPAQLTTADTVIYSPNKITDASALTANQARQGLAEKRQQLAELCEGPGVSGVTLQHRAARRHIEGSCIDRVHFSCPSQGPAGPLDENASVKKPTSQRKTTTRTAAQPPRSSSSRRFFLRSLVAWKRA